MGIQGQNPQESTSSKLKLVTVSAAVFFALFSVSIALPFGSWGNNGTFGNWTDGWGNGTTWGNWNDGTWGNWTDGTWGNWTDGTWGNWTDNWGNGTYGTWGTWTILHGDSENNPMKKLK